MLIFFLFGSASVIAQRNRLTKDTLSCPISSTQWIHVKELFMSWDNAS